MARRVKIGTISMELDITVRDMEYYKVMINTAERLLKDAADQKPDIMVLPEYFAYANVSSETKLKLAEIIPDADAPFQKKMSGLAASLNCNLVFGMVEKQDDRLYNACVVLDRSGKYMGKYRKVHLAPGEQAYTTPGDSFTVIELDICKIGLAICMDLHYPEMWTLMALEGAEIIAHPAAWMDYTGDLCESLVNARAIDNQVHVVTSHFIQSPYLAGKHPGHSRVVDPYGRTRADTSHAQGYAIAQVDLDQLFEYWVTGDLKAQMPTLKECFLGMRRPELYKGICEPDGKKKWKLKNPIVTQK